MDDSAVVPTQHAVETAERLRQEAIGWNAPTDMTQIPWAAPKEMPVIDLAPLLLLSSSLSNNHEIRQKELETAASQLRQAAHSTGFHYIIGHGIPSDHVATIFAYARRFHEELPEEAKESLAMDQQQTTSVAKNNDDEQRRVVFAGCGYLRERHWKLPAREKANMNASFVVKQEAGPRNVTLDNMPWPDEEKYPVMAGFRQAVEQYCQYMERLAVQMLPIYAVALGLPPQYFTNAFESSLYRLRLSRYAPTPPGEYGINPHVDTSFFTILKPSSAGLVVQMGDGWVRAPYRDDAFVVNFGELLSQITNDTWPATRHYALNASAMEETRVDKGNHSNDDDDDDQPPTTKDTTGARYALPFFFNATPTYRMAVVPTCCSPENPPRYPPTSYLEGQGVLQGE